METKGAVLTRSSSVFQGMFVEQEVMNKSISARIQYYVKKEKISQPKLALVIGTSRDTIFAYMNGKTQEKHMDIELLKRMAKYFGVEKYYFCNEYHKFIDSENVPEILIQLRQKEGVSQRVFAYMLEIPLASYKSYEEGRTQLPEKHWEKIYYLHKWNTGHLKTDEMGKFKLVRSNMDVNRQEFQERIKLAKVATPQMKIVLNYLSEYGEMTENEFRQLLGVREKRAYAIAKEMCKRRLVQICGRGKTRRYYYISEQS